MGNGPAPFSDIGKRAKDLLTKDYNYDHKFVLSVPGSTPMGLTATGLKKGQIFLGDISAQYKSGRTIVDVKVDTYSNVSTKVTVHEVMPSTKAILSFDVPDHKSGKLDLQYLHPRVAIDSSIGLNPSPVLNLAAAVGGSDILLGGEVGFDTASASFTKYTAGISFNKPDLSAALMLTDKGQTLKASYVHSVNTSNTSQVVAEMTHRLNTLENSFTIGSSHVLDRYNTVKTRFSDNGKLATEYILVSMTSAVTVTIAGVVKEAVTILVAVFYFHDEFTWLKGAGLIIIMFGVSLFNWYKYQKFQNRTRSGAKIAKSDDTTPARYVILEDMEGEEISP